MALKQLNSLNLSINNTEVKNAVKTFSGSKKYVKIMVRTAILNILYHRMDINEKEFIKKKYHDVPFVIYKRKSQNEYIREYHSWVNAIVDAIDKCYLQDVHMFLKDNNEIIEYYKISLKYSLNDDKEIEKKSSGELKEETVYLLQVLSDLGKHPKFTKTALFSLELTYMKGTPVEYEPPGFAPSIERQCVKIQQSEDDLVCLGKLHTGFHRVAYRARGNIFKKVINEEEIMEEAEEEEDAVITLKGISQAALSDETQYEQKSDNDSPPKKMRKRNVFDCSNITVTDGGSMDYESSTISDEEFIDGLTIDCLCKITLTSLDIEVVKCKLCGKWYHVPCSGYVTKRYLIQSHFTCFECDPSDEFFQKLDKEEVLLLARVRLCLVLINKEGKLPAIFELIPIDERNVLYKKLQNIGVYYNSHNKWYINRGLLDQNLITLFNGNDSQMLC